MHLCPKLNQRQPTLVVANCSFCTEAIPTVIREHCPVALLLTTTAKVKCHFRPPWCAASLCQRRCSTPQAYSESAHTTLVDLCQGDRRFDSADRKAKAPVHRSSRKIKPADYFSTKGKKIGATPELLLDATLNATSCTALSSPQVKSGAPFASTPFTRQ